MQKNYYSVVRRYDGITIRQVDIEGVKESYKLPDGYEVRGIHITGYSPVLRVERKWNKAITKLRTFRSSPAA